MGREWEEDIKTVLMTKVGIGPGRGTRGVTGSNGFTSIHDLDVDKGAKLVEESGKRIVEVDGVWQREVTVTVSGRGRASSDVHQIHIFGEACWPGIRPPVRLSSFKETLDVIL